MRKPTVTPAHFDVNKAYSSVVDMLLSMTVDPESGPQLTFGLVHVEDTIGENFEHVFPHPTRSDVVVAGYIIDPSGDL